MGKRTVARNLGMASILSVVILAQPVFAASGDISQVQNFIKSIIQILAGLAAFIAAGFFVFGGFMYITSSGNPEHLDRAKRTLLNSAIGLSIVIASFVITNIIADIATRSFGN